jgi:hypothetical protein
MLSRQLMSERGLVYSYQAVGLAVLTQVLAHLKLSARWVEALSRISDSQRIDAVYCGGLVDSVVLRAINHSIIDGKACWAATPAAFSANTTQYKSIRIRYK